LLLYAHCKRPCGPYVANKCIGPHRRAAHGRFTRSCQVAPMCTPPNTRFLVPTRVYTPNGISIGSALLVRYKLTVHRCLHNKAPQYLVDCCVPVSDIASRQRLRSARRCLLTVPRHRRSTLGRRAFSVGGPAVWNLLPYQLRDSDCTESAFRQSLKTFFFNQY